MQKRKYIDVRKRKVFDTNAQKRRSVSEHDYYGCDYSGFVSAVIVGSDDLFPLIWCK